MRTGLVTFDYPPAPSGLSVAAREIALSLAGQGAEVTVFALDRIGRETIDGITIVGRKIEPASGLGRLRLYAGVGHMAAPLAFRRLVLAEHRRKPFDIVEATNWYGPAALLARGMPFPLVTRNSTPAAFSRETATMLRDRVDALAADRLERGQVRGSAALISNTAAHAVRMKDAYGLVDDGRVHAVIGLSLQPEMLARGAAAAYPNDVALIRLLFVGRAETRKGFDTILGALSVLGPEADRGSLPPFELTLIGVPGSDLPLGLDPTVLSRLRALGRQPEAELSEAYADTHIVLAPSRYESFGLVYQEALAYGRPVVASAEDASARAFVGETGAGPLAARNEPQALADAIRPLLRDAELRRRHRGAALAAAGRFTRETLGRETLAVYRQAIARHER